MLLRHMVRIGRFPYDPDSGILLQSHVKIFHVYPVV
jgi:hypothetical protein